MNTLITAHSATSSNPPLATCTLGPQDLIVSLVSAQAEIRPHAPAVRAPDGEITYAELNTRADQLASHLRSWGVGPESIVGVLYTRCTSMIVSLLAVLKAGGAYLPIDTSLPSARIAFMLEDSGARIVLAEEELRSPIRMEPWRVISGEPMEPGPTDMHPGSSSQPAPKDLAYVIYTSGTTGRPKGVELTHSNLAHLVRWHNIAFGVTSADRASQVASLGFDAAVWEIWPYLAAGATLCLSNSEAVEGPQALLEWLIRNEITISFVPTPLAESMLELDWPANTQLRLMLTGGDTLHRYPSPKLPFEVVNNYGPTECTVVATSGIVPPQQISCDLLPSIGSPVSHAEIYILDEKLQPTPFGTPGELFIGGAGVSRGYHNLPELTVSNFIPSPFHPETRLYRTGDMVRYLPNGEIAFLGRIDDQIKIRGYRIEPDEIVSVLDGHPAIASSCVVAREDVPGDRKLIAYVMIRPGFELSLSAVQEFLQTRLPDYMVPPVFVVVDALLLTSNGKIDRTALPTPLEGNVLRNNESSTPNSDLEHQICQIVCGLLKLSTVSPNDNIFLLGGHSLLGTQLIAHIRQAFGVELPLLALFDRPSVRELAAEVQELLFAKVREMSDEEADQALRRLAS